MLDELPLELEGARLGRRFQNLVECFIDIPGNFVLPSPIDQVGMEWADKEERIISYKDGTMLALEDLIDCPQIKSALEKMTRQIKRLESKRNKAPEKAWKLTVKLLSSPP